MAKIYAVCSGSGGVGKTMIASSLAVYAAKQGKRTILVDAAGISRACDLVFGMESIMVLDLMDVVNHQAALENVLYKVPNYEGLRLASASLYDDISMCELTGVLLALHSLCDVLIIDLPTGTAFLGKDLLTENDCRVVVAKPDDVSIRACERMLMQTAGGRERRLLVVNRFISGFVRKGLQYEGQTVEMTLDCPLIGSIPESESIALSNQKGRTAIECSGLIRRTLIQLMDRMLNDSE